MPFPVACGCGQNFMAQDHLSGKEVPCPACGNPLLIQPPTEKTPAAPKPAPARTVAKPPAAKQPAGKPDAGVVQIAVRCGCGKAYKAPAAMRGKALKCPACGQDVPIPLNAPPVTPAPAPPQAAADPFGSGAGALGGDLFGADPFGGVPLGSDPLGGDLFGSPLGGGPLSTAATGGPLAMPMAGAPQPAQTNYGAPQAADDGGGNTKLLVILGVSVGVVLIGLFVGIWMVNRNKTPAVAVNTSPTPATTTPATPPTSTPAATVPESTPPAGKTPVGTTPSPSSGAGPMGTGPTTSSPMPTSPMAPPMSGTGPTSSGGTAGPAPMGPMPMGTAGSGSPGTSPGGTPSSGSGGSSTSSADPDDPPASRPIGKVLGEGLSKWHPRGNLKGVLRVGEGELVLSHYSWMPQILPFIGHQDIYDKFDFSKSRNDKVNLQLGARIIPEFLNPSDDRKRWQGYPFQNYALTHFVGMSGIEDARTVVAAKLPRTDPRAGIFGYDSIATPAEVTDGLSNTMMVLGGGEMANPWVMGGGATIRGAREPYFDKITGFGSRGTSGVTVVMADGSVRVISSKINPAVFRALCTIHGAEKIDLATDAPPSTDK